ncbi:hypothetical protein C1Y40_04616 [Mycobacterium talmoniae]|uniref:Uncharacterized protein n=1 Tax=Mycobacterium talmoniae TaxID=1858794 RepID=A0A2S8BF19_9MYCO|nr:hypothetical protein C1Y40_04616 [Mycobacterium talmoniae]
MQRLADQRPPPNGTLAEWDALFDTLLGQLAALAGRVGEAIQAQLPTYRTLGRATLDDEIGFQLERVLRSARGDARR